MTKKKFERGLVWVRRDLRLHDHTALSQALENCHEVAIVFVYDTVILNKLKNRSDRRVVFIHQSLQEVNEALSEKGSMLIFQHGDPIQVIPKVCEKLKIDALFFNEDYEPYAKKRDNEVCKTLNKSNVSTFQFKDQVIFSAREVLKGDGTPYRVFTPYKRSWLQKVQEPHYIEQKCILREDRLFSSQKIVGGLGKVVNYSLKQLGFENANLPLDFQKPGTSNGKKCLKAFTKYMNDYHDNRNFPVLDNGTSGLSVHLRFGTISVRDCVRESINSKSKGAQTWLSELVWRDFYQMILATNPHVVKETFLPKYKKIKWPGKDAHYKAWCQGKTGYPIVDAAMRQLNETGWMHNRLRMIVASFLTKDLLVDYKKGEAYFAEKLLDFDLSANNGGWQWSASTGCDAQPYFRIFNPVTQSERFDENGEFIRQYVPELASLDRKQIHFPEAAKQLPSDFKLGKTYPKPIVSHAEQKKHALALFKEA